MLQVPTNSPATGVQDVLIVPLEISAQPLPVALLIIPFQLVGNPFSFKNSAAPTSCLSSESKTTPLL
jgi:hypothetical protein